MSYITLDLFRTLFIINYPNVKLCKNAADSSIGERVHSINKDPMHVFPIQSGFHGDRPNAARSALDLIRQCGLLDNLSKWQ